MSDIDDTPTLVCQWATTTPPSDLMLRKHPEVRAAMAVEPTGDTQTDGRALRRFVALAYGASSWSDARICSLAHAADCVVSGDRDDDTVCALVGMFCKELRDARLRNDRSNAELFALVAGGEIAWVSGSSDQDGGWRAWDGARWRDSDSSTAERAARRVTAILTRLAAEKREYADALSDDHPSKKEATRDAKQAHDWACQSGNGSRIAQAMRLSRGEPGMSVLAEEWDADGSLLNLRDETVALKHSLSNPVESRPHRPTDRITQVTRCDYNDTSGERWASFIKQAVPDPEVRGYLQRLAGYSLLDGNLEQVIVFLVGPTGSGKSTFLEILGRCLGDYAASFKLNIFRGEHDDKARPDVIKVLPKRMIYTTEAKTDFKINADEIKRLVGGDTISARGLYKGMQERAPGFVPWIGTNRLPEIGGADEALRRRTVAVPFGHPVDIQHKDLRLVDDIVKLEPGSVLAWALDGWAEYCARGLNEVPAVCAALVDSILAEMSSIDRWFADRCELDPEHDAPNDYLWDSYVGWCNKFLVKPESDVELGRQLTRLGAGLPKQRTINGLRRRVRPGVHLLSEGQTHSARHDGRTGGISVVRD